MDPIVDLETNLYRVPPTVPWRDATHIVAGLEFVVLTLRTESGTVGTGYAYTTGVGGSAVVSLLDDYIAGMILGRDAADISDIWDDLNRQLHRTGAGGTNTLALAAVDLALWDVKGKRLGQPLHQLLGSSGRRIRAYASGIDLGLDLEDLLEHVRSLQALGFRDVKIKVGRLDPLEDRKRVIAVSEIVSATGTLYVDANQGWTSQEAASHLDALAGVPLGWVEEPLDCEDIRGHARLRASTGRPLAVGESLYTLGQFRSYLEADAVDVLQPDICRVGGVTALLRIAALAQAYSVPVAPHYAIEASLGVVGAIPNALSLEWVRGGTFSEMGILTKPLNVGDGTVAPWSAHGIGFEFDQAKLDAYHVIPGQLKELDLGSAR